MLSGDKNIVTLEAADSDYAALYIYVIKLLSKHSETGFSKRLLKVFRKKISNRFQRERQIAQLVIKWAQVYSR